MVKILHQKIYITIVKRLKTDKKTFDISNEGGFYMNGDVNKKRENYISWEEYFMAIAKL